MTDDAAAGPVLARLPRPRLADPVTLAVLADPHVPVDARGTWKVHHRAADRLRTAVALANAHADHAVLAGDLTKDGRPAAFDRVDEVLADLAVPAVAIPGNHDVPKAFDEHDSPPTAAFVERYDPLPFAREVGGLTLLGVNSASAGSDLQGTWGGRVGATQREWLRERAAAAETPVLLTHHNLGPLPEHPGGLPWSNFPAEDGEAVVDVCWATDVPLVVSAHHHVPAVRSRGEHDGEAAADTPEPPTEVLAPAVCSFPQASLHLTVGPRGTTVRLVPVADRAGVAEARRLARTGKPLGQGVLDLVETRLRQLPLAAERR